MEQNTRSRKNPIQKTNRKETVDVVNSDGDSPQSIVTAAAQTSLEARFTEARTNLSGSRQRLLRHATCPR